MREEEAGNIIKGMPAKICDMDIIPTTLLKNALPGMLPTITKIANASMTQGVFPSSWKIDPCQTLIKKLGLELIESNYRPVSNLPILSKVVEKCVLRRFNNHCKKYDLMPNYQSTYWANYSCETALVTIMDDILWSIEKQEVVPLIAIDLSAAFYTVDHDHLLAVLRKKIWHWWSSLKWFRSYLRQWQFRVQVGGKRSAPIDLPFSVPQGSCAGPNSAYASTLREVMQDPLSQPRGTTNQIPAPESDSNWQLSSGRPIDLQGFADNHAYKKGFPGNSRESEVKTIKDLEQCATRIKSWMDGNRLKMNDGKTKFIMFKSKYQLNKRVTHQININGVSVESADVIRYLGAWIDKHLSLSHHVIVKCKAAMFDLIRINRLRSYLTESMCNILVMSLVMSHIDYANSILMKLPDCVLGQMQRVQEIAAKIVMGKSKFDSSTQCRKALHWLPIRACIKHKLLTLVHRCVHG